MTYLETGYLVSAVIATCACIITYWAVRETDDQVMKILFRIASSLTVVAWFLFVLARSAVPEMRRACGEMKFTDAAQIGKRLVAICETADGGTEIRTH